MSTDDISSRLATIEANQKLQLDMTQEIKDGLWKQIEPRVRRLEYAWALVVGGLTLFSFIIGHDLLKAYDHRERESAPRRAEFIGKIESASSPAN